MSNNTDVVDDRSALDKLTFMKDAILDAIEIPIIAMWRDGSLAVTNKAIRRLMQEPTETLSEDAAKVLSRFKVYTDDFERELKQHEYPLAILCHEQKPFKKTGVGVIDSKQTRRVYEMSGDCLYDEKTGEFQAGICGLKDVTWCMDLVKAQSEQDERKFLLICEMLPQTVTKSHFT